ncbi:DeoR/GlpR family DNA-binding transcription regulator [Mycoplasmopsis sturni]|uniref:DeoR/GlpR family DNA-binding transcription regulator n=1 Tax=Mycoplasmopsis sturni TaxID=39047 RepID=UPI0005688BA6|nr:DeoR/GlpR family DNA-binding transcription regulator [Mycoplasmopsis sturni]
MSLLIEQKIIQFLKEKKVAKPKEIEEALNLPSSTARRYYVKLEQKHIIERTYGEIVYCQADDYNIDHDVNENLNINVSVKHQIAKVAAKLIGEYKVIYLDAGSSCYFLLDYLDKDITIYTNSVLSANAAASKGFKKINIMGGAIKNETLSIVDFDLDFVSKINFPIAFMGVNGITPEGKFTTPERREGVAKKIICDRSDLVVVLADSTKFNHGSFYDFTPKNKTVVVVSDINQIDVENNSFILINSNKGEKYGD